MTHLRGLYARYGRELVLLLILVGAVVYLGFSTNFLVYETRDGALSFNARNITSLLSNAAVIATAAVGAAIVIISGQIDISIGSILAVCVFAAGYLDVWGMPVAFVIPGTILVGALLGAFNGVLVAYAGLPSIIVTLGTLTVYRYALLSVLPLEYLGGFSPGFRALGLSKILGLPLGVWVTFAVVGAASYLMANSRPGRTVYAVGSSAEAALLAGVRVRRVHMLVLTLSGAFVGLAAAFHAPRFSQINANEGFGFEFVVITAVVLGGTSINGGSGSILGTLLGLAIIISLRFGMILGGVDANVRSLVLGAALILAVLAYGLLGKRAT